MIDLRFGRWQDALKDVEHCGSIITDPPYSERTHAGRRTGSEVRQSSIDYEPLTQKDVVEFIAFWSARATWFAIFGDHFTNGWWREGLGAAGLYAFAPIPWIKTDAPPRMCGDGPSSSTEWIAIARARVNTPNKRSRPGHYVGPTASTRGVSDGMPGRKPEWLMRALVRDYSEPGDLVVDPFAGSGTTLIAASIENRNAIGAEVNAGRFEKASRRAMQGVTPTMI